MTNRATNNRKPRQAVVALMLAALTLLASCSSGSQEASDVVSEQEAQRYRQETNAQDDIDKRNADLPTPFSGVVEIDGATSGSLTGTEVNAYLNTGTSTVLNVKDNGEDQAFQELCAGEIDLVDSARPISRAEWDACRSVGLDVVQFQIAAEAVVLAIKSETDVGGDCLTTDQVEDIYRAGSPITSWGQIGLEDVPLRVGGPDPDNTAFSFFGHTVLDSPEPSLTNLRSDYHAFPSDQGSRKFVVGTLRDERLARTYADRARRRDLVRSQLVTAWQVLADARDEVTVARAERAKGLRDHRPLIQRQRDIARVSAAYAALDAARAELARIRAKYDRLGDRFIIARDARRLVEETRGHVAYFRFSYYELFEDKLRPFEITLPTGDRNCIFPSQRTITSGEYPLSRQLLITTTTRALQRSEVNDFLTDFLDRADAQALDARLVPLPQSAIDTQQRWLEGTEAPILVSPDDEPSSQPSTPSPTDNPAR